MLNVEYKYTHFSNYARVPRRSRVVLNNDFHRFFSPTYLANSSIIWSKNIGSFIKILSLLLFMWPLKINNLSFLSLKALALFPHLLMERFNQEYWVQYSLSGEINKLDIFLINERAFPFLIWSIFAFFRASFCWFFVPIIISPDTVAWHKNYIHQTVFKNYADLFLVWSPEGRLQICCVTLIFWISSQIKFTFN